MKKAFNILIYVSLLFLVWYLFQQDYLQFRDFTVNPYYLIISVVLLLASFLIPSLCWWKALQVHGYRVQVRDAVISHGQSIFGKYIPGKVWVILGRAGYVSRTRKDFRTISFISLKEQLIYVWVGLIVSAVPTFIFYGLRWMSVLVLFITLMLSLILFSRRTNRLFFRLFESIFRRKPELPLIDIRQSLSIVWYELFFWFAISAAFFLLVLAFTPQASPVMALAYPLSVCLGVLAIIVPGGLGIREGILTGFLVLAGMDLPMATSISVVSRLWYILGEVFLFFSGSLLRLRERKGTDRHAAGQAGRIIPPCIHKSFRPPYPPPPHG